MTTQQIDVQIMGQSYVLGCPEGGQAKLMGAVRKVDEAMCKIRDAGKIKARDRIAVLAALNVAFEQSEPSPAVSPEPVPADTEQRLLQLLEKLDSSLAQDGQLI
jgi:cell division protein ZapA